MEPPQFWSFRVENWELGDTLGDIAVGQQLELALLFYPRERRGADALRRLDRGERTARKVAWNRYAVTGEVTFCGTSESVLDFGIPAVCENVYWEPPAPGATMSGEIELASLTAGEYGADFFAGRFPPIDFVWQVERIWCETTPWFRIPPRTRQRADVSPTFVEIEKTTWRSDDAGRADYVLDCRVLRGPTRR